jgi:hypothetical protein
MSVPSQPKIYHITHVGNLPQLVSSGWLLSDAQRIQQSLACQIVGMSTIKQRRLQELEVGCHPGTKVGEYAPFYFCPRSIMLYILYRGNHPEVDYKGGQQPIVHLQADLAQTIAWAEQYSVRWAFSDVNAGARYASFYREWNELHRINWTAVAATDFSDALIKDGKQAEFLLYGAFPWGLVEKIGVIDQTIAQQVSATIAAAGHQPTVCVEREWYY